MKATLHFSLLRHLAARAVALSVSTFGGRKPSQLIERHGGCGAHRFDGTNSGRPGGGSNRHTTRGLDHRAFDDDVERRHWRCGGRWRSHRHRDSDRLTDSLRWGVVECRTHSAIARTRSVSACAAFRTVRYIAYARRRLGLATGFRSHSGAFAHLFTGCDRRVLACVVDTFSGQSHAAPCLANFRVVGIRHPVRNPVCRSCVLLVCPTW